MGAVHARNHNDNRWLSNQYLHWRGSYTWNRDLFTKKTLLLLVHAHCKMLYVSYLSVTFWSITNNVFLLFLAAIAMSKWRSYFLNWGFPIDSSRFETDVELVIMLVFVFVFLSLWVLLGPMRTAEVVGGERKWKCICSKLPSTARTNIYRTKFLDSFQYMTSPQLGSSKK